MVNADEEMALGYLIDPCFELTNTAGKPLTDGWINVYVHGTRNKYYCYSDWNGNLHPFNIPLDGLGSNIVLASPQFTYDVYVFNKYGTLQMSRYNVSPVGVGDVSVSGINEIVSNDGTVEISQYGDTFDLSVPDITAVSGLVEDVAELTTAVSSIQEDIENLSSAVSGKKDKQEPYSFSETNRYTVSSLSQNADGKVSMGSTKSVGSEYTVVHAGTTSNKFAKIAEFSCYSGFSWVGSGFTNLVVSVSDAGGARQAMISVGLTQAANGNHNFAAPLRYYVSVNKSSTMELKEVYLFSDTPYGNNQTQATISLWAEFTDLSQKQWTFKAENNYATPGTGGTPRANAWEFANGQRYAVSALPTGGWQLNSQTPMYATETPDWNETNANARSYIKNKPDLTQYVTQDELATAVSALSVQSDWEQSDSTKPDYIKNKPDMTEYVTEEELASAIAGVTGIDSVYTDSTLRGDGTEGNPLGIDFPIMANNNTASGTWNQYGTSFTDSSDNTWAGYSAGGITLTDPSGTVNIDVQAVSGWNSLQGQIDAVSAMVPEAQVQSDWTEDDPSSKAYILNKPEEKDLVAGDGIDITVSGTSVIISSDNPAVTGYVTEQELAAVSGTLQLEIDTVSGNPRVKTVEYGVDHWSDVVAAMNGVSSGKYDYVVMKYTSNGIDLYAPLIKYEAGSSAFFACPAQSSDTVPGYGERRTTEVFVINSGDMWFDRTIRPFQGRLIGRGSVSVTVQGEDYVISGVSGGSTYTAGNNIDITNDVISVTDVGNLVAGSNVGITVSGSDIIISASGNGGASYTAGDNIDITNDVISVTGTGELIAGNNITITASGTDYVISSTGGGSSDIFIATYNVTPFADILAAYNDGKTIICKYPVTDVDDYLSCIYVGTYNQQAVKFDFSHAVGSPSDNYVSVTQASISYYSGWSVHTTRLNQPVQYTAGDNIDITNDTISVTGITELVAGNAITITASGASAIISSNGEAQVQSDWAVTDSTSKAYIKNKPTIPAAQVQSNWNETNTSSKAYIQNKPTIHTYTAGDGIDITSDVVSLDDPVGLVAGNNITIEVTGVSAIISSTGGGGTSYSAGNMISLANDTISVSTTAGITDIQQVAALPANPVSSVLYLIPEV